MGDSRFTLGDEVRIRSTDVTESLGVAGHTGIVYGYTTPSVTGVDVIGKRIASNRGSECNRLVITVTLG